MTLTGVTFSLATGSAKSEILQYAWRQEKSGAGHGKSHVQSQAAMTAMTHQFLANEVSSLQTKVRDAAGVSKISRQFVTDVN
jgi:hypothetical protein